MAAFLIHESVRVGPIIATFLTLHDFNLDHTWPVKRSSVIILGLTLSLADFCHFVAAHVVAFEREVLVELRARLGRTPNDIPQLWRPGGSWGGSRRHPGGAGGLAGNCGPAWA